MLKQTINDELLEVIKEMTGATGVFIVLSDSLIPCPDVMSGVECTGGHHVVIGGHNIDPLTVPQLIADATGVFDFQVEDRHGNNN